MDFAVQHTVNVAKAKNTVVKCLTVSFTSEGMMNIFMSNLFREFDKKSIPKDSGLHLNIIVPEDNDE